MRIKNKKTNEVFEITEEYYDLVKDKQGPFPIVLAYEDKNVLFTEIEQDSFSVSAPIVGQIFDVPNKFLDEWEVCEESGAW